MPIFIFPEGTRSKDGSLRPFKMGAFKLASDCDVPIVPITIRNTGKLMPCGNELSLSKGRVDVIVHEPILPENYTDLEALRDEVKSVIQSRL